MRASRVFITGCGGMLGDALYPYFTERCDTVVATDKEVSDRWLEELDVRDQTGLLNAFRDVKPDLVMHLAAETDLEFCETQPDVATDVNNKATREIAKLSKQFDVPLVYISTAGVFDGNKDGYYTEADEAKPIMVYGQTKFDGEAHVREICDKYFVVRAGWMVGGGLKKDHKFVYRILEQILENREVIHAVSDKWGTPTYTHDFANNLFALLDSDQYGTYHMVCEGYGTRYDVAQALLDICGRDDIRLEAVDSDFFKKDYFAPRPRSEMMTNANLRKLGLNRMRTWREALNDYVNREFSHAIKDDVFKPKRETGWGAEGDRRSGGDRRVSSEPWNGQERRRSVERRVA